MPFTKKLIFVVKLTSASFWVHMNLFWQLSGDGNLHGSGILHATTISPKPFFKAPWSLGDAVVGRGNAGWTTSKSGHPFHSRTAYKGLLLKKRLEEDLC